MRIGLIFTIAMLSLVECSSANSQAQTPRAEQTLCNDDEDIYFSCPLENRKIVSVCAKDNVAPNRGYVQYRYGTKDGPFVFPDGDVPPASVVKITDVSEGSIRGLHLKFSTGPYTYVVSSVPPGGVYVSKDGKVIFDKGCEASKHKIFSERAFDGINDAPVSKIDIH
jgi:hypothetical protein